MFRFLERLQARPEGERFAITIATAGGLTLLIFIAWVVAVGARIASETPRAAPAADSAPAPRLSDLVRDIGTFELPENAAATAAAPIADEIVIEEVLPAEAVAPTESAASLPVETIETPVRIEPIGAYEIR